jgi:hypothetical protein
VGAVRGAGCEELREGCELLVLLVETASRVGAETVRTASSAWEDGAVYAGAACVTRFTCRGFGFETVVCVARSFGTRSVITGACVP